MEMPKRDFLDKELELNDKIMKKMESTGMLKKIMIASLVHKKALEGHELTSHACAVIAALIREGSLIIKEKMK